MAVKGPDYSNENIVKILIFIQEQLCPSNLKILQDYLTENNYIGILFHLRNEIIKHCPKPSKTYADIKSDSLDTPSWEQMLTVIRTQDEDGFLYTPSAGKIAIQWEAGGFMQTFISKIQSNLENTFILKQEANVGFNVRTFTYLYFNELDHIASHLVLMIMNRDRGCMTAPARSGRPQREFQDNLYLLADCKPEI